MGTLRACRLLGSHREVQGGGQAIGHASQSDHLDISVVIPGSACVVVAPVGNAIIDEHAEEWRRHVIGVHALDDPIPGDLDVDEMPELPGKSRRSS